MVSTTGSFAASVDGSVCFGSSDDGLGSVTGGAGSVFGVVSGSELGSDSDTGSFAGGSSVFGSAGYGSSVFDSAGFGSVGSDG